MSASDFLYGLNVDDIAILFCGEDVPADCKPGKRDRRQSPFDRRGGRLPRRNDLK
jgi:hypothetical protein